MNSFFSDFDLTGFWDEDEYYAREYTDDPLMPEKVSLVEAALGYKLPASYIELMRHRNGGAPVKNCHRSSGETSWAPDHVAMTGFLSIGSTKTYSLCGGLGSQFMVDEWGYPRIGIYFADCPSAGHDMLCLDYRSCGRNGEPRVVHVDQDRNYAVTHIADSFQAFVHGLRPAEAFPLA
jgi:SMI1-KNR4 cell-wall